MRSGRARGAMVLGACAAAHLWRGGRPRAPTSSVCARHAPRCFVAPQRWARAMQSSLPPRGRSSINFSRQRSAQASGASAAIRPCKRSSMPSPAKPPILKALLDRVAAAAQAQRAATVVMVVVAAQSGRDPNVFEAGFAGSSRWWASQRGRRGGAVAACRASVSSPGAGASVVAPADLPGSFCRPLP